MAYVVSALWRAKEGCDGRIAEIIGELMAPSRAEPGCPRVAMTASPRSMERT